MEIKRILNAKYLKEPGYIFDLIFIFAFYFNKDYILNSFVNFNQAKEDFAFYNDIYTQAGSISEKLEVFFHNKADRGSLITKYYLLKYASVFLKDEAVTVESYTELFRDSEIMKEAMSKFYFPQIDHKKVMEMSIQQLSSLLDNMDYSTELKYQILNFYIRPEETIQLLIDTIREKESVLKQYHEKYAEKKRQMIESFDIYKVVDDFKRRPGKSFSIELYEPIYYSVCIMNKNFIMYLPMETDVIAVLGVEYSAFLEFSLHQVRSVELDLFGKILSEENRIKIIEMVLERTEVTKGDVVKELGISMTATHYHMDMMVQSRMLTVRNEGRTMYHSLNRKYFDQVIDMLKKYSTKEKGGEGYETVEMPEHENHSGC